MSKRHAWRSPSKGDLWVNCQGALKFIEAHKSEIEALGRPESSEAAEQGTLAHEYAENQITLAFADGALARFCGDEVARIRPMLKPEIAKNAEVYAQWVKEYLLVAPHQNVWGTELEAPLWYEPESHGTADFWSIEDGELLTVIDYKSGRQRVEVENNIQVSIYLIAIYDLVSRFYPNLKRFRAGIIQPFVEPDAQFWELDLGSLEEIRQRIGFAARDVVEPFLGYHTLTVTPKGCKFCPAKPICPAQARQAEILLNTVPPEDMGAVPLSSLLDTFKRIPTLRKYFDEVEDFVRDQPDEVLNANGFERRNGTRSYSWQADEAVVESELRALGVEPFESKLKSPAKVRLECGSADAPVLEKLIAVDFNRPKVVQIEKDPKPFKVKNKGAK